MQMRSPKAKRCEPSQRRATPEQMQYSAIQQSTSQYNKLYHNTVFINIIILQYNNHQSAKQHHYNTTIINQHHNITTIQQSSISKTDANITVIQYNNHQKQCKNNVTSTPMIHTHHISVHLIEPTRHAPRRRHPLTNSSPLPRSEGHPGSACRTFRGGTTNIHQAFPRTTALHPRRSTPARNPPSAPSSPICIH